MKFGVQLYGLDDVCKTDKKAVFAKLKQNGYKLVEPCMSLDYETNAPKGWAKRDIPDFMHFISEAGLQVISCHILCKDYREHVDEMVKLSQTYGIKQIVWNVPYDKSKKVITKFVQDCKDTAAKLKDVGASLLIHNGPTDISEKIEGKCVYEWILDECGGYVYAQPDIGWMAVGGENPEEFLWRNQKYIKSLHYKDFKGIGTGGDYTECVIGQGDVDIVQPFQFGRYQEIPHFVDMDSSEDIMKDMKSSFELLSRLSQSRENTQSILCSLDVETLEVKQLAVFDRIIEAPNWLKDNDHIIFNSEGKIYQYSISANTETLINTGRCKACNNDHVLSPDEKYLAISHFPDDSGMSQIYTLPVEGGEPVQITQNAPSYLHGWSPDGAELAYCAFRKAGEGVAADIYTIPSNKGEEKQLTKNSAFNDGPEYSPNGEHIWFNSTRTGLMQIWRMDRDGSNQVQMTFEDQNNWFAHISPDGSRVVNLSYNKDALDASEHLPNMKVELWLMDYNGQNRRRILQFLGGQGSINVNSWANDSKHLAFVMYKILHK